MKYIVNIIIVLVIILGATQVVRSSGQRDELRNHSFDLCLSKYDRHVPLSFEEHMKECMTQEKINHKQNN